MRFLLVGLCSFVWAAPLVHAQLFSDNFTRSIDPTNLALPWVAKSNSWTITGGALRGGTNASQTYGFACLTNTWINYSVQARFSFQVGAFGGGLGGRLNTNSGAHYVAWIYPENSAGGSNVLKLLKFQDWADFGYNGSGGAAIQQVNLASVSTNFHTVKLSFQTNLITVSWDSNVVITATDTEPQTYTNGGVSLDMWTDVIGYRMSVDDVLVTETVPVANNDSYTVLSGLTLNVSAPGVLANDVAGSSNITAVLGTSPTHGTFSLNANGSFTYTPTNNYTGADSFTYRATDGVSNSALATVSLTVTTNHPPVASDDTYTAVANSTLTVSAPGVLANDTDADGQTLTAVLVAGPANGTLSLSNNGSFTYTPNNNFTGNDTFTYRANDGFTNSGIATVTISVTALTPVFSDNFARTNDPASLLLPWVAYSNVWSITGGVLKGGTNPPNSYGYAYLTNSWTNMAVQARFQFQAGAFGGGIGTCLDPLTGAHYAAWIYPENSPGGSNILRLIKFQTWDSFSYNGSPGSPMAQANLAFVGTGFHTLKLAIQGAQLAIYLDGAQMMSVTDVEASPYTNGSLSLDMFTGTPGYNMSVDDVIVTKLASDDAYTAVQGTPLTVTTPGVLANDTEVYGSSLSAALVTGPTNGTLSLSNNGAFTYTASSNYTGPDTFIYRANDGTTNLGTAKVTLTVIAMNHPPTFTSTPTNRTINELTSMTVTNKATDSDLPAQTLTYSLIGAPAGVNIDTNGAITWTPTEAQGPSTNTITTRVTDNGTPPASATNSFTVVVNEVNSAPTLPAQSDRTINELTLLTVTNTATDTDIPANILTYTLLTGPSNAVISASGVITWTPAEDQGPSTNLFTTRVVDNGSPPLSATNSFSVTVNEVNSAPVLPAQPNFTIAAQTALTVANTATDSDIPANTLSYSLLSAPTNAAISASGVITWTPATAQDRSTNTFTTRVVDNGSPPLAATNTFTVFVNSNPVVVLDSTALILEGCTPTNNAIDPGESVTVSFSFKNIGTGPATNLMVTLLETNGVVLPSGPVTYGTLPNNGVPTAQAFSFAATGTCGGLILANFQLKDGSTLLGMTNISFGLGLAGTSITQNFDTVTAPGLPPGWTTSASGYQSNWVTITSTNNTAPNSVFSTDATNIGVNELDSPVFNGSADMAQLFFRNYYDLENFNTSTGYDGGVLEIKIGTNDWADILDAGGTFASAGYTHTISTLWGNPLAGRRAWSGASPGFTNTVVNLPTNAIVGQPFQVRWRCGSDNSTGKSGWRIDSFGISGHPAVCCSHTAPVLPAQADRTIAELTDLTVTNAATNSSAPASSLIYGLVGPPSGASIDTNGVITWSPTEAQGPSTNTITTVVTDNGFPPLSATNNFKVVVNEVNSAPVLTVPAAQTINELTSLNVSASATDSDIPANTLTFSLITFPPGTTINTNSGAISWTPSEAQGPSTNTITVVVTDNGSPPLSATNSFTVTVNEVNSPPVLTVPANQTINQSSTLNVSVSATDSDIPTNHLTFSLNSPPTGMTINPTTGAITWTPDSSQAPSTNTITAVVTDDGVPPLSATNSFLVTVNVVVVPAPMIQSITISSDVATITWSAVSNHTYRLQYQGAIPLISNWTDVSPDVLATGSTATATNACGDAGQRFYRVMLLP